MISFKYLALSCAGLTSVMSAGAATAQTAAPIMAGNMPLGAIVGNVAQIGVGTLRIGSPTGLIGTTGTPNTAVGISVLVPNNPPQGSVATVGIGSGGSPLTLKLPQR